MHFHPIDPSGDDDAYLAQGGAGGGGVALDLEMAQGRADISDSYDPFDDVFELSGEIVETDLSLDRPGHHSHHSDAVAVAAAHPSDMHRLQTEHTTAGYREGITAAKETTIQAGFDEGFSLGATLGLAAGQLLGILEAIEEALRDSQQHQKDSSNETATATATETAADQSAKTLLAEAREDLSAQRIFSPEFWAPDGNWTYDVESAAGGEEVLFPDVASAHPLIKKWTGIVDERMKLWRIDGAVMGAAEDEGEGEGEEEKSPTMTMGDEPTTISLPAAPTAPASSVSSKRALDW